jgi:hypothetical protein
VKEGLPLEVLVVVVALTPLSCVEAITDFGCFMDGPAVGVFPGGPFSLLVSFGIFGVCVAALHFGWGRVADLRSLNVARWIAAVMVVAFLAAEGPSRLLALSWTQQCGFGEARACFAAGNLYAHGVGVREDQRRAVALYRSGCDQGDVLGCLRILQRMPADEAACQRLTLQCADHGDRRWQSQAACEAHAKRCVTP